MNRRDFMQALSLAVAATQSQLALAPPFRDLPAPRVVPQAVPLGLEGLNEIALHRELIDVTSWHDSWTRHEPGELSLELEFLVPPHVPLSTDLLGERGYVDFGQAPLCQQDVCVAGTLWSMDIMAPATAKGRSRVLYTLRSCSYIEPQRLTRTRRLSRALERNG